MDSSPAERARRAVEEGEVWRAKEILRGTIGTQGYDLDLYEQYGELLLQTGELVEAGKYLFLSGRREPEYERAITTYLSRFTRRDSKHLFQTFPKAARLESIDDYPPEVAEALERLRLPQKLERPGVGENTPPSVFVFFFGCAAVLVLATLFFALGVWSVGSWVLGLLF